MKALSHTKNVDLDGKDSTPKILYASLITGLSWTIKEADGFKTFNSKNTETVALIKKIISFK